MSTKVESSIELTSDTDIAVLEHELRFIQSTGKEKRIADVSRQVHYAPKYQICSYIQPADVQRPILSPMLLAASL